MVTRDFTSTVFVVEDGRTLLLFHKKIKTWLPPGGHIHQDELPEEAARREVKEETGFDVVLRDGGHSLGPVRVLSQPECILLEKINPKHEHIDLIYYAEIVGGELSISEEEADGHRWCSYQDLETDVEISEDVRHLGKLAIQAFGGEYLLTESQIPPGS